MGTPNRHENLYCCKRRGVNYLIINTTQILYITVTIYFSYKFVCLFTDPVIAMALGAVGIIGSVYIWFFIMPSMLDSYALTTSVSLFGTLTNVFPLID